MVWLCICQSSAKRGLKRVSVLRSVAPINVLSTSSWLPSPLSAPGMRLAPRKSGNPCPWPCGFYTFPKNTSAAVWHSWKASYHLCFVLPSTQMLIKLLFPGMRNGACVQIITVWAEEPLFISVQRSGSPLYRWMVCGLYLELSNFTGPEFRACVGSWKHSHLRTGNSS